MRVQLVWYSKGWLPVFGTTEGKIKADLDTMILALAASQIEMAPFLPIYDPVHCQPLLTGVGPVETAVRLGRFLATGSELPHLVVNFGVAGAYQSPGGSGGAGLLDICLAESEVLGDFGICFPDRIEALPAKISGQTTFSLRGRWLTQAMQLLGDRAIVYRSGPFVTVNGCSGSRQRGDWLGGRWQALAENMEGAAVARCCTEYDLPLLEVRVISNLVEDRHPQAWRLTEACLKAAEIAALLIKELR